jgi:hypothetical protein
MKVEIGTGAEQCPQKEIHKSDFHCSAAGDGNVASLFLRCKQYKYSPGPIPLGAAKLAWLPGSADRRQ